MGSRCGDGNVDDGEECDDGNTDARATGCAADCTIEPVGFSRCGTATSTTARSDDGNTDGGDGLRRRLHDRAGGLPLRRRQRRRRRGVRRRQQR
ncbi:MAG: hypothetical protein R3F43_03485 [bacterium]